MMRNTIFIFVIILIAGLGLSSCGGSQDTSRLKQIQQEQAGGYLITVFHPTGKLKAGRNNFVVEFRSASDNQLADLGDIRVGALMPMGGMAPMMASASAERTNVAGRYKVTAEFSMKGTWYLNFTFGSGQKAGLPLDV